MAAGTTWGDRLADGTFVVLFGLYLYNVLGGKAEASFRIDLPRFGDVWEFLLLLACAVALIVAALRREAKAARARTTPPTNHQGVTS